MEEERERIIFLGLVIQRLFVVKTVDDNTINNTSSISTLTSYFLEVCVREGKIGSVIITASVLGVISNGHVPVMCESKDIFPE